MSGQPPPALVAALVAVLAKRPEVLEAYVFGSQARAEASTLSDVDIAVYIEPTLSNASPYGPAADLATVLGSAAGRNDIDVVILNEAPPLLYHRVIAGGDRIFARDLQATTTREGRALSRYCDYLPQLRRIDEAAAARLAMGTFGQ